MEQIMLTNWELPLQHFSQAFASMSPFSNDAVKTIIIMYYTHPFSVLTPIHVIESQKKGLCGYDMSEWGNNNSKKMMFEERKNWNQG